MNPADQIPVEIMDLAWLPPISDSRTFGRDASNPYYDFLHHLVKHLAANRVLELGTYEGGSTAYLASARSDALIVTVDIEHHPAALERLKRFPNVKPVHGNTLNPDMVGKLAELGPFDLLFIDTLHEYAHVKQELEIYRPLVRLGGVIVFDDIRINEGMVQFWHEIDLPKQTLNHLHASGFGVVML